MTLQEFWDTHHDQLQELISSLIGSCTMGGPDYAEFGLSEDDEDLIIRAIDEDVYECESCGWWCDGGDRYHSDTYGGDVCEECMEDE